jgi:hypothetical protein
MSMLQIDNTLVSDDIVTKCFCCDLTKCFGNCCFYGSSGAPLEKEETIIIKQSFPKIKPYLSTKGYKVIKQKGLFIKDEDGDIVTPLVNEKDECAYAYFEDGITLCAIEKAFIEKKIEFRKPLSCHLYPIRIKQNKEYDAVNYDHWDICTSAIEEGIKKGMPVYEFLKDPLIRKYGPDWYEKLCAFAKSLYFQK